ncbi:hypothetical protein TNCV_1992621 [Trichonephila clavipes]|nr:hypothetical protein TNCV_1992621 [Trichonephila clavipes]
MTEDWLEPTSAKTQPLTPSRQCRLVLPTSGKKTGDVSSSVMNHSNDHRKAHRPAVRSGIYCRAAYKYNVTVWGEQFLGTHDHL